MKRLILSAVMVACLFTVVARAEEDVRSQLAGQLLGLMDVEKNLKQSLDMVRTMQMEQIKKMTPPGQDAAKAQAMQAFDDMLVTVIVSLANDLRENLLLQFHFGSVIQRFETGRLDGIDNRLGLRVAHLLPCGKPCAQP